MTQPPPSIEEPQAQPPELVAQFDLNALAAILVREQSIKEGNYEVSFGLGVHVGGFQSPADTAPFPGAAITIINVTLVKVPAATVRSVDASTLT